MGCPSRYRWPREWVGLSRALASSKPLISCETWLVWRETQLPPAHWVVLTFPGGAAVLAVCGGHRLGVLTFRRCLSSGMGYPTFASSVLAATNPS